MPPSAPPPSPPPPVRAAGPVTDSVAQAIAWAGGRARGASLLVLGGSAGLVPIGLARLGFRVLGIEPDAAAVRQADLLLDHEAESVRARVQFRPLSALGGAGVFETVLVCGPAGLASAPELRALPDLVLAHLVADGTALFDLPLPDPVLADLEQPDPVLADPVFGGASYTGIGAVRFPAALHALLHPHGQIGLFELAQGRIRAVLHRGAHPGVAVPPLAALTEQATAFVLDQASRARVAQQTRLAAQSAALDAAHQRLQDERLQATQAQTRAAATLAQLEARISALQDHGFPLEPDAPGAGTGLGDAYGPPGSDAVFGAGLSSPGLSPGLSPGGGLLRVAGLLEDAIWAGFAPECDLLRLGPELSGPQPAEGGGEAALDRFAPQMLLLDSGWIAAASPALQDAAARVLGWSAQRAIPSALWIRDSAPPDAMPEALARIAGLVDHVFLARIDQVGAFRAVLGHPRVHGLPFACQPRTHNPLTDQPRLAAFRQMDLQVGRQHAAPQADPLLQALSGLQPVIPARPDPGASPLCKGYTHALTVSTDPAVPALTDGRICDLLAMNVAVVGPYARGARLLFGDLVTLSDSGAEILQRLQPAPSTSSGPDPRVGLAGLRKVMTEHTYAHRLAHLAARTGLAHSGPGLPAMTAVPAVTVIALAVTAQDRAGLLRQFARQRAARKALVLLVGPDAENSAAENPDAENPDVTVIPLAAAQGLSIGEVTPGAGFVAFFAAGDHYGAHYLQDLLLATRYSTAGVIGKAAAFRFQDGAARLQDAGHSYRLVPWLRARSAMLRRDRVLLAPLVAWAQSLARRRILATDALAIDPFNHCLDGSLNGDPRPGVAALTDDLDGLDSGWPLPVLLHQAEAVAPVPAAPPPRRLDGARLAAAVGHPAAGAGLRWHHDSDGWQITATLATGKHLYVYETGTHPLEAMLTEGKLAVFVAATPGLRLLWVVLFLDQAGERLDHALVEMNRNVTLTWPEGTARLRFGLRVAGSGRACVQALFLGRKAPATLPVLGAGQSLLVTNNYPSHGDLYRNAFVHRRAVLYRRDGGARVDVFRLRPDQDAAFHGFDGVDCLTGSAEQLDRSLREAEYASVLVHFVDPEIWAAVRPHLDRRRVVIWVHGAEIQPWWRRAHDHETDAARKAAQDRSAARLAFWRDILTDMHPNLHLVFVSDWLAEQSMQDLGLRLTPAQYSVIHNPVDTDLFRHVPKTPAQRGRILSVRPYVARTYANDLSVAAIGLLRDAPFFADLQFHLVGQGPLFEATVAPLRGLSNVTLENRFLTQQQIAALHREAGIFLCPSRMDTQGVSRDEAMSSGLVPVTSRVAAIPEFVDESCGCLTDPEDAAGLAAAIAGLYHDPARFIALSAAAARRVRAQSGQDLVIARELRLIAGATAGGL